MNIRELEELINAEIAEATKCSSVSELPEGALWMGHMSSAEEAVLKERLYIAQMIAELEARPKGTKNGGKK